MKWLDPDAFDWGESPPLSSFKAVTVASLTYTIGVILCTYFSRILRPVQNKKKDDDAPQKNSMTGIQWRPWFNSDLKNAQFMHNVVLVVSSAIMFLGVVYESWRRIKMEGGLSWPSFLLCEEASEGNAQGALYYWSYIYYLSKYYEFLDTILQLARGKPPPHFALHVYHHALVLFMAWAWCNTMQSLQFIGLAFNTAVHVVMYSYFLQRTITGKVPAWKSFVTLFQIIQFACSMLATCMTLFAVYIQGYECAGMKALFGNVLFNLTLLQSFIGVFKSGKKKKPNMVSV
mmetsp:Transcript_48795/g.72494  ORF Transcript_48795/g.72494 Transcript_48795/m.72494 type:complete len:288 (+) Transcript_48795:152-1015(+)|eukprot:CAMPEP_0195527278 /NCGR_PEP_ID=MMETSP0794_2-20130614/28830_1 /TAXON_ID=515487 /ORGANISM="Stephanopyxis turris, Strain CCMP 815" /LENGTH=287 /DNA_ID=CAMNT_0040658159 /DNA_START=149 /DNA_END=1012 /DNA_ORIENTATION=-